VVGNAFVAVQTHSLLVFFLLRMDNELPRKKRRARIVSGVAFAVDYPLMIFKQCSHTRSCLRTHTTHRYAAGAVTFLFINQNENSSIALSMYQGARLSEHIMGERGVERNVSERDGPWGPEPPAFPQLPRVEFVLTAPELLSRTVDLNGKVLELAAGMMLLLLR
jgi:hypothetical protein